MKILAKTLPEIKGLSLGRMHLMIKFSSSVENVCASEDQMGFMFTRAELQSHVTWKWWCLQIQ